MSADNGVYILETNAPTGGKEFRVAYGSNIENLHWNDDEEEQQHDHWNLSEIKRYFGQSKVHNTTESAEKEAEKIAKDYSFLEYGIAFIEADILFPSGVLFDRNQE